MGCCASKRPPCGKTPPRDASWKSNSDRLRWSGNPDRSSSPSDNVKQEERTNKQSSSLNDQQKIATTSSSNQSSKNEIIKQDSVKSSDAGISALGSEKTDEITTSNQAQPVEDTKDVSFTAEVNDSNLIENNDQKEEESKEEAPLETQETPIEENSTGLVAVTSDVEVQQDDGVDAAEPMEPAIAEPELESEIIAECSTEDQEGRSEKVDSSLTAEASVDGEPSATDAAYESDDTMHEEEESIDNAGGEHTLEIISEDPTAAEMVVETSGDEVPEPTEVDVDNVSAAVTADEEAIVEAVYSEDDTSTIGEESVDPEELRTEEEVASPEASNAEVTPEDTSSEEVDTGAENSENIEETSEKEVTPPIVEPEKILLMLSTIDAGVSEFVIPRKEQSERQHRSVRSPGSVGSRSYKSAKNRTAPKALVVDNQSTGADAFGSWLFPPKEEYKKQTREQRIRERLARQKQEQDEHREAFGSVKSSGVSVDEGDNMGVDSVVGDFQAVMNRLRELKQQEAARKKPQEVRKKTTQKPKAETKAKENHHLNIRESVAEEDQEEIYTFRQTSA